ncbi:MAG: 50S ribosome-binding GTPase, partial [Chromatiaceae bacterium]|nr:50S ribosome-binding GTPase [Chromatiaceae bacterium]
MSEPYRIGVVGNPNCGKTTLFNALTGAKQRVGNWPGVTVERKIGRYQLEDAAFELVDLPGTYALDVTSEDVSLDEKIARDYVHGGEADLILNIVDASNLERNLYLTSQLLEMRRPMVVALNMMDAAEAAGLRIDVERLAEQLGCPVVPVVAVKREGIKALKQALAKAVVEKPLSGAELRYDGALEQAITALRPKLERAAQAAGADPR